MSNTLNINVRNTKSLDIVAKQIGQTPLLFIESLSTSKVKIFAKAEWQQLGNSVKARAAFQIIKNAFLQGDLDDRILLDASSGNTAIAYASICAKLNIPLEICLPANASQKRKEILLALGTTLRLTSELEGTDGAQLVAATLHKEYPGKYYYADQYNNDANWQAHYLTTAEEIFEQSDKDISHFICGLGTTGSFTGNSKRLKELNPRIKTIAVQPNSPMHILEGWKHLETAKVPGIYNSNLVDEHRYIDSMKSLDMIRYIAKNEGLLLSPSSAGNLLAAQELAREIPQGNIVTILPDDASKYDEILKLL